jgi:hypothetical protein
MFQPFRKATQAATPDLSTAVAQEGMLENQAKKRANALRQQNIGNAFGGAKLYNETVEGTPIADYMGRNDATVDVASPADGSGEYGMNEMPDIMPSGGEGVLPEQAAADMVGAESGAMAGAESELMAEALGGSIPGAGAEAALATEAAGAGSAASGGLASAAGTAMPWVGAAMALYSLLNQ